MYKCVYVYVCVRDCVCMRVWWWYIPISRPARDMAPTSAASRCRSNSRRLENERGGGGGGGEEQGLRSDEE